jgi:hypothetical protein
MYEFSLKLFLELSRDNHTKDYANSIVQWKPCEGLCKIYHIRIPQKISSLKLYKLPIWQVAWSTFETKKTHQNLRLVPQTQMCHQLYLTHFIISNMMLIFM